MKLLPSLLLLVILSVSSWAAVPDLAVLREQVTATETAFARSMAERKLSDFSAFIAEDAVFFGSKGLLHGRQEVVRAWTSLFTEKDAPFSWKPEVVEVLAAGNLAISHGPVFDREGKKIRTFTSIWRLEPDGKWRIVFDKGEPLEPKP